MALNHSVRFAYEATRRWWQRGHVWESKSVQQDQRVVATYLQEPEYSPVWGRYIGLIVPRDATHTILSDASYAGIGGLVENNPTGSDGFRLILTTVQISGYTRSLVQVPPFPLGSVVVSDMVAAMQKHG